MKSSKKVIICILTLVLVVALALTAVGCKRNDQTDKSSGSDKIVTDMVGREVNLGNAQFRKVVCIGAGALRMYSYVGDMSLIAGVEDIDNYELSARPKMFDNVARPYMLAYADDLKGLPSCGVGGPNAQSAEAEKILLCNPDIVISEYEDVDKENALQEQLGIPVVTVRYGAKGVFDDNVKGSLTLLGAIFGKEAKAKALCNYIDAQKAELSRLTEGQTDQPAVYICGLGNWGTTNHLMTAQNYEPFNVAHIRNAVSGLANNGIGAIDAEKLASIGEDVDVMIIDAAAVKNIKPLYAEDPHMFDGIKAWREGNVYLEMAYNAYYTNLEIALINSWYAAKVVYPQALADVDIDAKTKEVTEAFLGKDLTQAIKGCAQSYGGYQQIDTETFFD